MKKLLSIILLILPVAVMAGNFTGNEIRISAEAWNHGNLSTINIGSDVRVKPFYNSGVDVREFGMVAPGTDNSGGDVNKVDMGAGGSDKHHFWSIDFHMDAAEKIDLIYNKPPGAIDYPYNYWYETDLGFHFEDVEDTWRPIVGVTVSASFSPVGFDPSAVKFDENNIYVNLKGSSCVTWSCANASSPTGLNNIITLNIEFEGDPHVYRLEEINMLFDWAEKEYPGYFSSHEETFYNPMAGGFPTREYDAGVAYVDENMHLTWFDYGFFVHSKLAFGHIEQWLHFTGIEQEISRKKNARRKAVKEEKARQEEEARQAKLRWEEANRGPYDPYHEESDSYTEPLDSDSEPLD